MIKEQILSNRIRSIVVSLLIFISVIVLRLVYLQIYNGDSFLQKGERNFLRMEILDSPRGDVVDRAGRILATNQPVYSIYWEGSGNRKLRADQEHIISKVFSVLEKDFNKDDIKSAERHSRTIKIADDISFSQLCQISEQCAQAQNLVIINNFKRLYPFKNVASHILGYLGQEQKAKFVGRYGLEKVREDRLEGRSGYVVHVTNSTGRRLEERGHKNAEIGERLKLTLDLDLQLIAESVFKEDQAGVFIVMDPEDGAIRAMVSYPNFNPNLFVGTMNKDSWSEISSGNSPFLNRTLNALYPPASIFKLVTFSAGLEEGVIHEMDEFDCKGHVLFYGRKYNCISRAGHGLISCNDAIAYSCNIPCYEIAKMLRIDTLADYANRFGLGRKTGFAISEQGGLVPTRNWKRSIKGENWWKGETLSASIGQSYLLVTPLQIARMIASLFTGYLVRPRILDEEEIEKEPLNIKPSTLEFLRNAMRSAVEFGSGKRLKGFLKDFSIYSKTGTAQTSSLAKAQLEHGWFAAGFEYKGEKPLIIISIVERAGASLPPLMLAKKFLRKYAALKERTKS